MVNIEAYIENLIKSLKETFRERLLYVGLQGSYLRGDATEQSDVDIMVVLDWLTLIDLDNYRLIVSGMEHYNKSCGFICGKQDLAKWNAMEICQLVHGTKDYYGVLQELVPTYTNEDLRNYIKFSLNSMYHTICHGFIHDDFRVRKDNLKNAYKPVFYILQNLHYLRTGVFVPTKAELMLVLKDDDRRVLECANNLLYGRGMPYRDAFKRLFTWCQETMFLL